MSDFNDTSNENITQNLGEIKPEAHADAVVTSEILENDDYTDDYDWGIANNIVEPNRFYGFLIEGGITFVVSGPGGGKTYLAMSIALDMATKYRDMKVFYVDLDNPVTVPKDRGLPDRVLERGLNNIVYLNELYRDWVNEKMKKLGKYEEVKRIGNKLKRVIKEITYLVPHKRKLVIFDSFQNFVDYNDDGEVRTAFQAMRECKNTTFLIIHHVNKQGSDKGLTRIKDSCDSMYFLESKHDQSGGIVEQTLEVDLKKGFGKMRFQTDPKVTFKYTDNLVFDVVNDVAISKDEKIILRIAVKLLRDQEYTQSQLVQKIVEKTGIGKHKTRQTVIKYTGRLFNQKRGDKNAIYYTVIEDSDILKLLFDTHLSDTKQKLLDNVVALIEAGEELEDPIRIKIAGREIIYDKLNTVRNSIYAMKEEEAELMLDWLKLTFGRRNTDN